LNKHTKVAILIAPFLLIGGYIAADYYAVYQYTSANNKAKFLPLSTPKTCAIQRQNCRLNNGPLILNLSESNGTSTLNSNHPLETVAFSLVNNNGDEKIFKMKKDKTAKNWTVATHIEPPSLKKQSSAKLRLMVTVNKAFYFAEIQLSR